MVACTILYTALGLSAKPYSWQTAPAAAASVYDFRPAGGDTPVAIGPNVAQATVQKLKQEVAPKPLVAKPTARQTAEKLSTVERLRAGLAGAVARGGGAAEPGAGQPRVSRRAGGRVAAAVARRRRAASAPSPLSTRTAPRRRRRAPPPRRRPTSTR